MFRTDLVTILHPVESFPSSLPLPIPGWTGASRGAPLGAAPGRDGAGVCAWSRQPPSSPFLLPARLLHSSRETWSRSSSTGHRRGCPCSCRAKCPHQHSHGTAGTWRLLGTQLPAASLVALRLSGKEAAPQAAAFVLYLFSKTNRRTVANARTKLERFIKLPLLIKKGEESRAGAAL